MKIAYFDCFSGISGDMTLGALLDAGLDWSLLKADLDCLPLRDYELYCEKVEKKGITGLKVNVITNEEHQHRHWSDIKEIILSSNLPEEVKEKSLAVFLLIAEAEAKVHGTTIEDVHFHEVGAVDTIIDIVGSVAGLWRLGIEEVYASALHTGKGLTYSEHGIIPIPAPATLEILKGVPCYTQGIEQELVTPTGAAIIKSYSRHFGEFPLLSIERVGYGAGQKDLTIPNLLRVVIGEKLNIEDKGFYTGQAIKIEVNIDDMNPEFYDYLMQKLFEAGALDVYLQPIQMKKNRPGVLLSVQFESHLLEKVRSIIFSESTSIGMRMYPITKYRLPYEIKQVETEWGTVRVKIAGRQNEQQSITPEYEDCRELALKTGLPLKQIYDIAKYQAYMSLETDKRTK